MIVTYLLESQALPDPLTDELRLDQRFRLSKERMEKIRRIKHPGARKQSFAAGMMLGYLLHRFAPGAQIQVNDYGKPFCQGVPFNLSHTADAVILSVLEEADAVGLSCPAYSAYSIGCDIEKAKPYKPRIARRFFTEAEYMCLEAVQGDTAQAELFCRYWTKKESVMKLSGLGMSLPMDLYDVRGRIVAVDTKKALPWYWRSLRKGQEKPGFAKAAEVFLHHKLFLKEYAYQEYCITVCSTLDAFAPEVVLVHFDGQKLYR